MVVLSETAVSQTVNTRWLGKFCRVFPELDSTNDLLKEMVQQGTESSPPTGCLLLTEYQRQGRGRLERRWEAPPGSSLLLSMLFRPDWPAEQANWLTMLVSTAAAEAISEITGLEVGLKWPNDIMVRQADQWCKVSGILQEGSFGGNGRLQWAIVGIGINVNIPAEQLPTGVTPATSLLAATGQIVPRLPLLAPFLQRVENYYDEVGNGRSPHVHWHEKLITLGQPVRVTQPQTGSSFTGIAQTTDAAGHLLVQDETGQLHTVTAADVTLR
ncbi:MAG: biotin--[acetyl-CoA-carboxylase] ligase [Ardenticatenaceae bacterium]|nr:biotin--[acetyl-CoA-carboxylase] ligase [Anaerolineales bacterium]MCB8939687.1 biotin--[acetyl-CoA-carboxylase] ligase [Ardenticatenaceae bacterium]MCB8974888.1 biotin--[acetyl-CoA-carboxylase] ligase [Ardenticatenaceae bacterium]